MRYYYPEEPLDLDFCRERVFIQVAFIFLKSKIAQLKKRNKRHSYLIRQVIESGFPLLFRAIKNYLLKINIHVHREF